jgi:hypothetical protein
MEPLIVSKKDPQAEIKADFADMFGDMTPNPIYYQHVETEQEYWHLLGGIAWPVVGSQKGCVLIIGATREDVPTFEVIDEFFSDTPRELLRACFKLRDKYGFENCRKLFRLWIGEDRFQGTLRDVNMEIKDQKHVHLTPPPDFDKPNSDEIYIEQIRSVSADSRLIIPSVTVLDSMKAMTLMDAGTLLVNTPVAACIGYLLHEMLAYKPWQLSTDTSFNMDDEFVG